MQPSLPPAPVNERMQVDSFQLSQAECQCRINNHLCLCCGSEGVAHLLPRCPVRPPRPAVSTIQIPPMIAILTHTTISVTTTHHSVTAQALIDSDSASNFISRGLLKRFYLKKTPCQQNLNIHSIAPPLSHSVLAAFTRRRSLFWCWMALPHPGKPMDADLQVHQRGSLSRIHPSVYFLCCFQLLLHG